MKTQCVGLFGWLFGHKFEAFFDEKSYLPMNVKMACARPDVLRTLRSEERTYRHSICRRCGESILEKLINPKEE